jgi:hypothetical protein
MFTTDGQKERFQDTEEADIHNTLVSHIAKSTEDIHIKYRSWKHSSEQGTEIPAAMTQDLSWLSELWTQASVWQMT